MGLLKNNMNLDEALHKFREYKPGDGEKDVYSYHKVEEYIALLDKCFGIDGYRVHYSDARMEVLPSGQCMIMCKATIHIHDQNDHVVYSMEGYGSYKIEKSSKSQDFIILNNAGNNATVQALKSACGNSGAFGIREEGKPSGNNNKGSGQARSAKPAANNSSSKAPVVSKGFVVMDAVEFVKSDQSGKPIYRLLAHEIADGRCSEKKVEILFYPNQYSKYTEKLNSLVAWSQSNLVSKGKKISMQVRAVDDGKRNNEFLASYVFKGFN
jgi:hypothetical protein